MKQKIVIIAVALVVLGAGLLYLKSTPRVQIDPNIAKFNDRANKLIEGLQQYKEFFKHYPTGTTAEISKALLGQAEGKVVILVAASADKNDKGEITDPWGTPLQFYFSYNGVLIRSAGPNRIFEDSRTASDDLFRTDTK